MLEKQHNKFFAQNRQLEQSKDKLRTTKVLLAERKEELVHSRTYAHNWRDDIDSLRYELKEAQSEIMTHQATIVGLTAAKA